MNAKGGGERTPEQIGRLGHVISNEQEKQRLRAQASCIGRFP